MMNSEQQQHISTTNAITTAKILTRDVLPKLTGYLDASDVVEFYAVTRMAKLKTPPFPQPRSTDAPTVAPTSNQTMQPTKPLNYGDDDSGLNDGGSRGNINATNSTSNSYYYSSTGSGQSNNDDGNRTLMGWPNIWGRGDVEEEKSEYVLTTLPCTVVFFFYYENNSLFPLFLKKKNPLGEIFWKFLKKKHEQHCRLLYRSRLLLIVNQKL